MARMALLLAGLPHTVPGETVNRLCASGMATIHASRALHMGDADVMISGGVEHIGPLGHQQGQQALWPGCPDARQLWLAIYQPQARRTLWHGRHGHHSENLVALHDISREDQDQFAAWSQAKAAAF